MGQLGRRLWIFFCHCCTFLVPNVILRVFGIQKTDAQLAWREKVTLCMIIFCLSASLLVVMIGTSLLLCPEQKVLSKAEFRQRLDVGPHCIIHGEIYNLTFLAKEHEKNGASQQHIFANSGKDVSAYFPPPIDLRYKFGTLETHYGNSSASRPKADLIEFVHSAAALKQIRSRYHRWFVGFTVSDVERQSTLFRIDNLVFDTTRLKNGTKLSPIGQQCLSDKAVKDKSACFTDRKNNMQILASCFAGIIDIRQSTSCLCASYILIGSSLLLVIIILIKFFVSLRTSSTVIEKYSDAFVIIQVPCFTEDEESLKRTINSITTQRFPDKHKLLFIVADGLVSGPGSDRMTPAILLEILGIDDDLTDTSEARLYYSVSAGNMTINSAKVYSGVYECSGQRIPFIFVVKIGVPGETFRPGNRGKRDSQLILLHFLSQMHYQQPLNPLEMEIYRHMDELIGIDPNHYDFVMMVDADTEVRPDSMTCLVSSCMADDRVMGICGETRISNEGATFVTMIQVYEYFISHNLTKAFESLFGAVTCLPGCFCMYRIRSSVESGNIPLVIKSSVLDAYSKSNLQTLHEKNLLFLGEDRYLTTLMLRNFPGFQLKYTKDASCRTIVPETWSALLSQRRRWINSTIHNLYELLSISGLFLFCCQSLRFFVLVDLFGTLVMPASVIYLVYLVYQTILNKSAPAISLLLILAIYGIQAITFLHRKQWQYIGWLALHLISIPLSSFIIPLYAYWHFDDFSWGKSSASEKAQDGSSWLGRDESAPLPLQFPAKRSVKEYLEPQSFHELIKEELSLFLTTVEFQSISRKQLRKFLAAKLGVFEPDYHDILNAAIDDKLEEYK